MKSNSTSSKITLEEIKSAVMNSLNAGDKIHISKKSRVPIIKAPAVFKGAYNHFIRIEAHVNSTIWETFTISYSELFIGDAVIHELDDLLQNCQVL